MRTHLRADCTTVDAARATFCLISHNCFGPAVRVLATVLCLVGCAPPPPAPVAGHDPADPNAGAPPTEYRSAVGPYTSLHPSAPTPPREPNADSQSTPKSRP
jgi:hypothetical protein